MEQYKYTWKIGIEPVTGRMLQTNKPVLEGMTLVDFFSGDRFAVQVGYKAKANEKLFDSLMPDDALQTWPVGRMDVEALKHLRVRYQYEPNDISGPLDDIAFAF